MGVLSPLNARRDVALGHDDPFVSRVGEIEIDGYAPRSLTVLRAGWRAWCEASRKAGVDPLPASETVLLAELRRRVEVGQKRATIETQLLFPLRAAHRRAGLPCPTQSQAFRDLWRKLCRERLASRQRQAVPLNADHLDTLARHLDPDRKRDALLGALCWTAYDGMLRVSELVAIRREHIQPGRDGSGVLLVPRSKTDQEGEGALVYLRPETMTWIDRHLRHEGMGAAWIFPSPYRGGHAPITTRHAANLIAEAGTRIGVWGLSGHSGRVGAAQDMAIAGASLPLLQRSGRWKSPKQPARYGENADAKLTGEARFDLLRKR